LRFEGVMFDDEAGGFKLAESNSMLNRGDIRPATKPQRTGRAMTPDAQAVARDGPALYSSA
jgi:hypothetical protein